MSFNHNHGLSLNMAFLSVLSSDMPNIVRNLKKYRLQHLIKDQSLEQILRDNLFAI